jgi:uncharacterized membrane protein
VDARVSVLAAVLDPYLRDWLDLLLRTLHVIAAIAWIGTSFYFVLLDQSLRPPKEAADADAGVRGELWEVHGGGFYRVQKYQVAPRVLPDHLAWFKWEAYTTWLSGFGLMVVLYYLDARAYLIDPEVADLEPWAAVTLSAGLLVAAWVVYDLLCRFVRDDRVLGAAIVVLVVLASWGATQLFSPRAAFLQVGAMLGTVMAANVLFVIIPAQWELIRAKQAGREPDPAPGIEGKRRSVHNNYLTLPVLLAMLGGHFAFLYGHDHVWLVLVALMALGAWTRVFYNLRHGGRTLWWIPAVGAVGVLALAFAIRPDDSGSSGETVPFADVAPVVEQRCAACHATNPTQDGFSSPPAGIVLETPAQIAALADEIRTVVASRAMPLGNVTGMTDAERDRVVAWVDQGASTE